MGHGKLTGMLYVKISGPSQRGWLRLVPDLTLADSDFPFLILGQASLCVSYTDECFTRSCFN